MRMGNGIICYTFRRPRYRKIPFQKACAQGMVGHSGLRLAMGGHMCEAGDEATCEVRGKQASFVKEARSLVIEISL